MLHVIAPLDLIGCGRLLCVLTEELTQVLYPSYSSQVILAQGGAATLQNKTQAAVYTQMLHSYVAQRLLGMHPMVLSTAAS